MEKTGNEIEDADGIPCAAGDSVLWHYDRRALDSPAAAPYTGTLYEARGEFFILDDALPEEELPAADVAFRKLPAGD